MHQSAASAATSQFLSLGDGHHEPADDYCAQMSDSTTIPYPGTHVGAFSRSFYKVRNDAESLLA